LNDSVGLQSHAIAVAQAVGLPFSLKRVQVTGLVRCLPVWLQMYFSPARLLDSVAPMSGSAYRPRLIIAIGRRSVPIALLLKSRSEPPCFALHIRYRKGSDRQFDLVAAPMNNAYKGANVMATFDAVYNVTPMNNANNRLASCSSGSITDIDVVASLIKGALGLERPRA